MKIKGEFEAKLNPIEGYAKGVGGINMQRMSLDKTFHGTLDASSKGEMLSARTPVDGSAGYVAIELVTGELAGKRGSFVLQHFGIMDKGKDRLILEVIPDSGTDELEGLSGLMKIDIRDGKHFYEFDFELN